MFVSPCYAQVCWEQNTLAVQTLYPRSTSSTGRDDYPVGVVGHGDSCFAVGGLHWFAGNDSHMFLQTSESGNSSSSFGFESVFHIPCNSDDSSCYVVRHPRAMCADHLEANSISKFFVTGYSYNSSGLARVVTAAFSYTSCTKTYLAWANTQDPTQAGSDRDEFPVDIRFTDGAVAIVAMSVPHSGSGRIDTVVYLLKASDGGGMLASPSRLVYTDSRGYDSVPVGVSMGTYTDSGITYGVVYVGGTFFNADSTPRQTMGVVTWRTYARVGSTTIDASTLLHTDLEPFFTGLPSGSQFTAKAIGVNASGSLPPATSALVLAGKLTYGSGTGEFYTQYYTMSPSTGLPAAQILQSDARVHFDSGTEDEPTAAALSWAREGTNEPIIGYYWPVITGQSRNGTVLSAATLVYNTHQSSTPIVEWSELDTDLVNGRNRYATCVCGASVGDGIAGQFPDRVYIGGSADTGSSYDYYVASYNLKSQTSGQFRWREFPSLSGTTGGAGDDVVTAITARAATCGLGARGEVLATGTSPNSTYGKDVVTVRVRDVQCCTP